MFKRMNLLCAVVMLGSITTAVAAGRAEQSTAEVLALTSTTAGLAWSSPRDGGTPRDPARIEAIGVSEFRIRARDEEHSSPLKHAVSRVDLILTNRGAQPQDVTVHLDLSGDGSRTIADQKPSGGMSLRDFFFIQPPGAPWRQVQGSAKGWVCTVRFTAPPGETRVGLSPWYAYGDYLRFIQGLPAHPHLKKERLAPSDGGREQWELTITDPTVPAQNKRRVFWHAREHAYESYSSYAMEGLVGWLLSDAAAEARRRYAITIQPMTNVDGVAAGNEYRKGYDHPDPRGTASARLVFGTLDRLRPDLVITWHNWVAPRDMDSLFLTDSLAGKPARRAWDLFTQHFPSPRAVGHHWEDESQPEKRNWFGRSPLNTTNPHQYAMKKYGSAVWGWEMPWWNRTPDDAQRAGAEFGRAFTQTQALIEQGLTPDETEAPPVETPRWTMHEFALHGRAHVANPFRDAALVGEFTSPSGKTRVVEGFFDGGDTWRLRFAPDEEGEWRYRLRGEGAELAQQGRLRCTGSRDRGFIGIDPKNSYGFTCADGTPFFPMGDTCYGLFDDSHITPALRRQYLETRRGQHFNFVRLSIGHSETRAASEPSNFWAWGGTPAKPDLDRFNPAFFRAFDALLREMQSQGMNAEVLLLNFYRRPFTDTKLWTPERERLWLRYVMARYGAFENIFLWTLANEYETHPDGRYRLDRPADLEWVGATARLVKQLDPYRHPVTVHPVISSSIQGTSPRAPFDPPWRIGGFFGKEGAIDVLSQQTSSAYPTTWDEALGCWTGDAAGVSQSIAADRVYRKPVLNTEYGYEYLRGNPSSKRQVHHTDKVRRAAWRIVCAGGYFAAGFHGTLGHSDAWERIDAPRRYPFVVKDEGAGAQLGYLYDFFAALPFSKMQPFGGVKGEAVALAEPGRTYVVYLPQGGKATVDLSGARGPLSARWFNPRDEKWGALFGAAGGGQVGFQAPNTQDWALLLCRPSQR